MEVLRSHDINFLEAEVDSEEEQPQPVPPELLEALPQNIFTAANQQNFSDENKLCTICQGNYEVGEKYLMLMCLHRFHVQCIKPWF